MFWELPGPRRYVSDVLESLDRGRHAVLHLPDVLSRIELQSELRRGIHSRSLGDLTAIRINGERDDPLDEILEHLGSRAATVEELLKDSRLPSRFLLIETAPSDGTERWEPLLRRVANYSQVHGHAEIQLVVVCGVSERLVAKDLFLSVHSWWGCISQLDVEWAAHQVLRELPATSRAEHYWIRALCRGLAISDPALAAQLVERRPTDLGSILELLSGGERSADRRGELDLSEVARQLRPSAPPKNGLALRLWKNGDLDWHDELGGVVLTKHLAARGEDEEIRRRLWLGQLEILLPAVEHARLDVCSFLTQLHGAGWPQTLCARAGLSEGDAVSIEIGTLAQLAGALKRIGPPLPKRLSDAIFSWRHIRNELAHWRPVTYAACERAFLAWEKLRS